MSLYQVFSRDRIRLLSVLMLCLFVVSGCAHTPKKTTEAMEVQNLAQPKQNYFSAILTRFNSGITNILTGPLELFYQWNEEVKRTDPVRGLVPGIVRGIDWVVVREVVGAFEVVTFFVPLRPHLKPFNTDWLKA